MLAGGAAQARAQRADASQGRCRHTRPALRTRHFRSCRTEGVSSGCARSCRTVRSRVPRSAFRDVTLSPSGPLEDGVVADAAPSQAELIVDGDELERCAAIGTGE